MREIGYENCDYSIVVVLDGVLGLTGLFGTSGQQRSCGAGFT
jgi:hypothetical protein